MLMLRSSWRIVCGPFRHQERMISGLGTRCPSLRRGSFSVVFQTPMPKSPIHQPSTLKPIQDSGKKRNTVGLTGVCLLYEAVALGIAGSSAALIRPVILTLN